mgnify:CR=1 FL=1
MSVGDIKGSRRRFKQLRREGHAPRAAGVSVSVSIERARKLAAAEQKRKAGKK